jgi:D-alanine-D-alanine ligase
MYMATRQKIALLFGGRSGEHEVSIRSGESVARGLSARYDVLPVLIDHQGRWWLQEGPGVAARGGTPVFMVPSPEDDGLLRRLDDATVAARPDVYFPVLHGTYGEDGTVQGLLELAGVPFVGSGTAASAAAMDKVLMKALFAAAGLPQAEYRVLLARDRARAAEIVAPLGLPLFVKPANLGSSVGVSKVKEKGALAAALELAFAYDRKVVVEAAVPEAREIEISVLGNDDAEASLPGEIVPDREFYDYDSKYSADSKTELRIPAPLDAGAIERLRKLGVEVFRAVDASGYARVDFLMEKKSGRMVVNEINTIPGFTSISMFPKLWEATGLRYEELLGRLVDLGIARHRERAELKTDYTG